MVNQSVPREAECSSMPSGSAGDAIDGNHAPSLGSLHAFLAGMEGLGPPIPGLMEAPLPAATVPQKSTKAGVAAGPITGGATALPRRPQRDVLKDGTLLNKRLAFRMLKQLGCEVKREEPVLLGGEAGSSEGASYIEVRHVDQPVLFQMLLEFGYRPFRTDSGVQAIRVNPPRLRPQEETVASLAAPRRFGRPRAGDEEDEADETAWPSMPRQRLDPEREKELVSRLTKRKEKPLDKDKAGVAPQEPTKFRSAAEQRAHLDRLVKPRECPIVVAQESDEAVEGFDAHSVSTRVAPTKTAAARPLSRERATRRGKPGAPSMSQSTAPAASAPVVAARTSASTWPPPIPKEGSTPGTIPSANPSCSSGTLRSGSLTKSATSLGAARTSPSPSAAPVRPSPRLTRAGLSVLSADSPSTASTSMASSASPICGFQNAETRNRGGRRDEDELGDLPLASLEFSASEVTALDLSGCSATEIELLSPSSGASPEPHARGVDLVEAEANTHVATGSTSVAVANEDGCGDDWLDKVLGPPSSWPGRAASTRTSSEQREAIQRLSKPRRRPGPADEVPSASEGELSGSANTALREEAGDANSASSQTRRSPKSQREASSRLAAPRQPKVAKTDEKTGFQHSKDAQFCDERTLTAAEQLETVFEEAKRTSVVPSILSQCQGPLERIDEEESLHLKEEKSVAAKTRRRARASSMPATATAAPYAVPVCPAMQGSSNSGSGRNGAGHKRAIKRAQRGEESMMTSKSVRDLTEDHIQDYDVSCEDNMEMLTHIDQLYTSYLRGGGANLEPAAHPPSSSDDVEANFGSGGGRPPLLKHETSAARYRATRSRRATSLANADAAVASVAEPVKPPEVDGGGEELLADIDQLYTDILGDGKSGCVGAAPTRNRASDTEETQRNAALAELRSDLEEVLWSAVLLKRGSSDRVNPEAKLLILVPPQRLVQAIRACGPDALAPSLVQRVAAEMPRVKNSIEAAAASPPGVRNSLAVIKCLASLVHAARDALLSLASSAEVSPALVVGETGVHSGSADGDATSPTSSQAASESHAHANGDSSSLVSKKQRKRAVKKSSLSYWTFDSDD
eukprot:TRINITY_DN36013_c0_g2_i1.p1 TRINITY_DN36013_c0_g2~~TRINITY_DN36013_c0_g2_i1.p1  ORF type:complete len:1086 (-),score=181.16 TRINITY_DN36013_c0_g2_i1:220-3477(-)